MRLAERRQSWCLIPRRRRRCPSLSERRIRSRSTSTRMTGSFTTARSLLTLLVCRTASPVFHTVAHCAHPAAILPMSGLLGLALLHGSVWVRDQACFPERRRPLGYIAFLF